jgi:hypothetical protein
VSESKAEIRAVLRKDPDRVREMMEMRLADEAERRSVLSLLVDGIRQASAANPASWSVTLRDRSASCIVGGLYAVGFYSSRFFVSLKTTDMTASEKALVDPYFRNDSEFRRIEGGRGAELPVSQLANQELRGALLSGLTAFIEEAAENSATLLQQKSHSPSVLDFLETSLNVELPRPDFDAANAEEDEGEEPPPPPPASVRISRPRTFKDVHYDIGKLLSYLQLGDIALPDLQRPFVWKASKVRDFFDSIYQGFPIGTLTLWASQLSSGRTKGVGADEKQHEASLLVVDGQQRLTSLYAVIKGKTVVDKDFQDLRLEIAFRPRDGRFEVTSAAIRKDPEWIPDISTVWSTGVSSRRLINGFIERLRERRPLTQEDEDIISDNLDRLIQLTSYPITTLEIGRDVDEEAVADIFVRINNGGARLVQADFILTLLSVHSLGTRRAFEDFARRATEPSMDGSPSPFNRLIKPEADQLLRVAIAVGFYRARLMAVYQLLRGKDPNSEIVSRQFRDEQLRTLHEASDEVLDVHSWSTFLTILIGAGFRSDEQIVGENAVLNAYALYLIGKLRCGVSERDLGRVIARWFYASILTGRYSGSTETALEEDLARVKGLNQPGPFVDALDQVIDSTLTNDFWRVTLPLALDTSASSPVSKLFRAAQMRLGTQVLFSQRRIADLYDPLIQSPRKAIEEHHIFPKKHLVRQGITETKLINQAGNLAPVEWPDNADVSDDDPKEYVPRLRALFSADAWDEMCAVHGLPPGWENLSYAEFLRERRTRMAEIIRRGFDSFR